LCGKVDRRRSQLFDPVTRHDRRETHRDLAWAEGDNEFVEFVRTASARLLPAAFLMTGDLPQAGAAARTYAADEISNRSITSTAGMARRPAFATHAAAARIGNSDDRSG
jgi:hypothetical protein